MPDELDSLALVYSRRLDERVDRLSEDMRIRVTGVEKGLAGVHHRFEARLDHFEKRLDLMEAQR